MKYLHLVLRSLFRSRRRTLLTVAFLAVSVFLVATLQSILATLDGFANNPNAANRVAVRHKVSLTNLIPMRYQDWIRQQPEVEATMAIQWFGGIYQDPRNFFANFAAEPEPIVRIFREEIVEYTESEFKDFLRDRNGCIVGKSLADKFGWKVGDVVTLQGTIFPMNPRLTVRGTWKSKRQADEQVLYFHFKLLEEGVPRIAGRVGSFWVRAKNADDVPRLIERIDRHFSDALEPTQSETENAFQLNFLKMMGNIAAIIHSITGAVLAALLVVTANTMAMAIRERTTEVAVFRAMGFTSLQVLGILMAEGILLSLMGGVGGIALAWLGAGAIQQGIGSVIPWLADFAIPTETLLFCLHASMGLGLLSTLVPAWRAVRRPIIEGLRAL
ncbi:MAG: ABC transporter permease [Acidobacteria bacterium]|nr:ABC transporter permease [Acidobacteriota bacterium]